MEVKGTHDNHRWTPDAIRRKRTAYGQTRSVKIQRRLVCSSRKKEQRNVSEKGKGKAIPGEP